MAWILNLCRKLRPWFELSQNAVSGHGHVLRYCELWLCSGMTHFELLFLTQTVSYWWCQFELRHCNSCLHENAIVWKMIWIELRPQNVSFIISVPPTLSDSRQVAAFVVFFQFRVDPFEIRHPPHPTFQRGNTFLTEFSLIPEDYRCGCYSVIPTLNLTLLCQPSITRLK